MTFLGGNFIDFGRSEEAPERPGAVPGAFPERPERLSERVRRIMGFPGASGVDF